MGQLHDDPDDQHLRERREYDPVPMRWLIAGLAVFWLAVVLVARGCQP